MKKLILIFFAITIMSFANDFNGYDWGTSFDEINKDKKFMKSGTVRETSMINGKTSHYKFKTYKKIEKLGNIENVSYTYYFIGNKLARGIISKNFTEGNVANGIVQALNSKYGKLKTDTNGKNYRWYSERTDIILPTKNMKKNLKITYKPKRKILDELAKNVDYSDFIKDDRFSKEEIEVLSKEL